MFTKTFRSTDQRPASGPLRSSRNFASCACSPAMLSSIVSAAAWASRRRTSTCSGLMGSPSARSATSRARRRALEPSAQRAPPRLHRARRLHRAVLLRKARATQRQRRREALDQPVGSEVVGRRARRPSSARTPSCSSVPRSRRRRRTLHLGATLGAARQRERELQRSFRFHLPRATPRPAAQTRPPSRARPRASPPAPRSPR